MVTISLSILVLDPGSYVLGGECLMVFTSTISKSGGWSMSFCSLSDLVFRKIVFTAEEYPMSLAGS